jgi:hypothetical protein
MPKRESGHDRLSSATALVSATLAASCCLLPLALMGAGLGGAGLMMTMMRYEWLTLPAGAVGLAGAYAAYIAHRRRCSTAGCRFVGERTDAGRSRTRYAGGGRCRAAACVSLVDGHRPGAPALMDDSFRSDASPRRPRVARFTESVGQAAPVAVTW